MSSINFNALLRNPYEGSFIYQDKKGQDQVFYCPSVNPSYRGAANCLNAYQGDAHWGAYLKTCSDGASVCQGCGITLPFTVKPHQVFAVNQGIFLHKEGALQFSHLEEYQGGIVLYDLLNYVRENLEANKLYLNLCPMCEHLQHIDYAGSLKVNGSYAGWPLLFSSYEQVVPQSVLNAMTWLLVLAKYTLSFDYTNKPDELKADQERLNRIFPDLKWDLADKEAAQAYLQQKLDPFFDDLRSFTFDRKTGLADANFDLLKSTIDSVYLSFESDQPRVVEMNQAFTLLTAKEGSAGAAIRQTTWAAQGDIESFGLEHIGLLYKSVYERHCRMLAQDVLLGTQTANPRGPFNRNAVNQETETWLKTASFLRVLPSPVFFFSFLRNLIKGHTHG